MFENVQQRNQPWVKKWDTVYASWLVLLCLSLSQDLQEKLLLDVTEAVVNSVLQKGGRVFVPLLG